MAKYNLNLRDGKADKETPINLVIRYSGLRLVYSTGEVIIPSHWDKDRQKGKGSKYSELNGRLSNLQGEAEKILSSYLTQNNSQHPTPEELRDLLNTRLSRSLPASSKQPTLFEFLKQFNSDSEARLNDRTGKPISLVTIRIYRRVTEVLRQYAEDKHKRRTFDFEQILEPSFYSAYQSYLMKEHKFSTNTVGKHIKTLKTFLIEAQERGLVEGFRPKRFKVVTEKSDSIYLSKDELEILHSLDLSKEPRLDRVRDLFLVGCWTGLRFSDFSRLTLQHFVEGEYIEIETQKTTESVVIPIHPTVKKIMAKYAGKTPNSLPPTISNVKMNLYLKELGKLAGLENGVSTQSTKAGIKVIRNYSKYELLTTHTARRSFASNMFLAGIPVLNIMAITGHRTEAAFMKYIKLTRREHAQNIKRLWDSEIETPILKKVL